MAPDTDNTGPEGPLSVSTQRRKNDHIRINLEEDVYSRGITAGFEEFRFVHNALPELNLSDVDTVTAFLGRQLDVPILISSMTGGTPEALEILRNLASAAEHTGCAIGVGSQRAALEDSSLAAYYNMRDVAPTAFILANIGAVQLNYGLGVDHCRRAVEMIGADALILHLNPLQEAIQEEGNHDFSRLLHKIGVVCDAVQVPVVVKEVGFGISPDVARRLVGQGVHAIDISGAGGTSWSAVEVHRAGSPLRREVGEAFVDWGIPTATALQMVRNVLPQMPLIASGGLRNGVDAAKAFALGADMAGFAGPLLRAATEGESHVIDAITVIREQLRLAMFSTGSRHIADLRRAPMMRAGPNPALTIPSRMDGA
jgi:isopentenyl-diphosphate delta-isomerase